MTSLVLSTPVVLLPTSLCPQVDNHFLQKFNFPIPNFKICCGRKERASCPVLLSGEASLLSACLSLLFGGC